MNARELSDHPSGTPQPGLLLHKLKRQEKLLKYGKRRPPAFTFSNFAQFSNQDFARK